MNSILQYQVPLGWTALACLAIIALSYYMGLTKENREIARAHKKATEAQEARLPRTHRVKVSS